MAFNEFLGMGINLELSPSQAFRYHAILHYLEMI